MSESTGRLGLSVRRNYKYFELYKVEKPSAAERAGVRAGDLLLAVEDKSVGDWSLDDVMQILKGEPGTFVKLTLVRRSRGHETKNLHVMLEREAAYLPRQHPQGWSPELGDFGAFGYNQGPKRSLDHNRPHTANAHVFGEVAQKQHYQAAAKGEGNHSAPHSGSSAALRHEDSIQSSMDRIHLDSLRPNTNNGGNRGSLAHANGKEAGAPVEENTLGQPWIHVPEELTPSAPTLARDSSDGTLADGSQGYCLPLEGGTLGLSNMGNTCFLNSILQCLLHSMPFVSYTIFNLDTEMELIAAEDSNEARKKSVLVSAFKKLCGHMWSGTRKKAIEPRTMLDALKKDPRCCMLFNFKQQDAHECLTLLLDALHQDTNGLVHSESPSPPLQITLPKTIQAQPINGSHGFAEEAEWDIVPGHYDVEPHDPASQKPDEGTGATKVDSVVSRFMGGRLCGEVRCKRCGYFTHNQESFFTLSMPLPPQRRGAPPQHVTLEDLFKSMESEEPAVDWACDKCNQKDASKRMWIVSHPKIMIVHLERFGHSMGSRFKRDDAVFIPTRNFVRWDMPVAKSGHVGATAGKHHLYELVSWTEHIGATDNSGHYISFARHLDRKIRKFDDHRVDTVSSPEGYLKSKSAYILFYERQDS
mmetsp:Transcript_27488/g.42904  ORF Transcript_27488/g.42904 Transcript_27488/m.42904 type:complete len:643 (+) Transcript_27488:178-2106(+)|eukprot:CAMPEP_0184299462 /NCGR_PEP_ID=MMETSP1049-20130417/10072_1 /TAXON_ID=77928 /ORGANISM="Proteomonas sulcata, Strain CCMP704" /LENGTH=642 /DNA_ID=CAMNT_0026609911 /DNA_START=114 /DNA_END=2042 /DNA_ORIENTATION=+